jgi:patatin-like phospholipase/acyl hydrolase
MKIILSIDGGGIRGIVPAAVLAYLEKKIQEIQKDPRLRLANLVDFVSGTSTGSIVGSMMLIPDDTEKEFPKPKYEMQDIVDLYFTLGDSVFKKDFTNSLKTVFGLFGPKFPANNIEKPLLKYLDHYKMKDLIKPCMFAGYDIEKRQVNFYTNHDDKEKYAHYYVKDVVRGSTSIPAFFPPARFQDGVDVNTIVDGGVFANNPSLASMIEVSKTIFQGEMECKRRSPHDLIIISLGTGDLRKKSFPYKKSKKWGKAQWMMPVIDVLLSSHAEVTDYEMRKIFESYKSSHNYHRINPPILIGDSNGLNASKENLILLLKDVENYIEQNKQRLHALAHEIIDLNYLIKGDCE